MVDAFRNIEPPFSSLKPIKDNRAVNCRYEDPYFPPDFVFEATLLPGAEYVFVLVILLCIPYYNVL